MLKQFSYVIIGLSAFILVILVSSSIYIVDETKQVFVTRFGKIIGDPINSKADGESEAGLYFRIPFKYFINNETNPAPYSQKKPFFIFFTRYTTASFNPDCHKK